MNNKVKWGIIGPGHIAQKFAADLLLSENGTLHAVASRDADKAKSFADQYKASTFYSDYESLAMDSDVDVVYVATPHAFHYEHTMLCLKNGKSVLCEKPMGMTPLEVQTMIAEAQKRKLFLMEGLWTRFIPATEKVLSLIDNNTIGNITSIGADFGFKAEYNVNHRLFNKSLGGGSLLDIGIYPLFISLLLLGFPDKTEAKARMTATGVDALCDMVLHYENGVNAVLKSTITEDTPTEAIITGENGSIIMHKPFHHSQSVTVKTGDDEEIIDLPYEGFGYLFEIEEVNRSLAAGKTESSKLPLTMSHELYKIIAGIMKQINLDYQQ
jgi:predicted dehydrogenase